MACTRQGRYPPCTGCICLRRYHITRTAYTEAPPRVEYALSELGETMRPILDAMEQWGAGYQAMAAQEG